MIPLVKQKKKNKFYAKTDEEEEDKKSSKKKLDWSDFMKFNYNDPNHRRNLFLMLGVVGIAGAYFIFD
jgi:hypothetical protein